MLMRLPKQAAPPTLHELQSRMQAAILDGDDGILALIPANSRTGADTLFGVYRHAYRARLVEVLGNDYGLLRALAGADVFQSLALGYINANPSRTQNARWFGSGFPAHLARIAKTVRQTLHGELADIEKALADAFDSADAPALTLTDVAQVRPEDWARLAFTVHPSVTRLSQTTNAFAVWRALRQGNTLPRPVRHKEGKALLAWRDGTRPMLRPLPYEEAMMLTEAGNGACFGVLCEMLATFDDPDRAAHRAASYLHGWLSGGLLSTCAVRTARASRGEM